MRYVFAECVLDTQLHTLHRAGMAVRLRPKVFHVLRYLLEHGDHVVSMDELCTHVWPGQFISDATIEADPTYALAYSGLADAYTTLGYGSYLAPEETFPHAKHAAVCALTLDARLAEPHTSLAYVKLYYEWDWAGAERAFQQAIALNPHYATAHHWYSVYLTAMERPDEARREIQRAHELDPLSLIINTDMGFALYYTRQYDQAIAHLRTTLEMNHQFPLAHLWLGRAYQQQGKYAEALAAFHEAGTVL
jgi:tetratricopeptide (TPR) repeat protein